MRNHLRNCAECHAELTTVREACELRGVPVRCRRCFGIAPVPRNAQGIARLDDAVEQQLVIEATT